MTGIRNKTTSNGEVTPPTGGAQYALTSEAGTVVEDLVTALDRRKKLNDAVETLPREIAAAKLEHQQMTSELASMETDVVWIDASKLPALQKDIAKLSETIQAKDLEIRRAAARLGALEERAPEIDGEIKAAIQMLNHEAVIASDSIQAVLAEELRSSVVAVRTVHAKIRALQKFVPILRISDFLLDAYIPDLDSCMRLHTGDGSNTYKTAPNLLAISDAGTQRAEAEIEAALKPISDAMRIARGHHDYVPIAKRPQPYVIKGSNEGLGRGVSGPIGKAAPAPRMIESKPFQGYRTDQPYEIKGDQSGIRTRQAGAELNMSAAVERAAREQNPSNIDRDPS
jgi:hypothetical protein